MRRGEPQPQRSADGWSGPVLSRRWFLALTGAGAIGLFLRGPGGSQLVHAVPIPGGTLDPGSIPKFVTPLLIPPVMPRVTTAMQRAGKPIDVYEISMRQLEQQVLPAGYPTTTVWGYGPTDAAGGSKRALLLHHAPSLTIEAQWGRPVRVRWVNDLIDDDGGYLPHLLPVDPTLHWANPPGGTQGRDTRPTFDETPGPYTGPVPMVTHVHGSAGVGDESDGYAEAWFLPDATDIPDDHATEGTWFEFLAEKARRSFGGVWGPGFSVAQYPNTQRAGILWYHDHTLGMTRLNVYAGPAGFYLLRGGPGGDSAVLDSRTGAQAVLPGPAPRDGDKSPANKAYREIPLAIQDRAFNADGSLFYPDSRAFFDGITGDLIPEGEFSPIWNPEFFGNMIMVNGATWPTLSVDRSRYRFRLLNGCQSRFLILDFDRIPGVGVWQVGNEGGFLEAPFDVTAAGNRLLLGPAERADVIVDFTDVEVGNHLLANVGPDEPFGGGVPGLDFDPADGESTGMVLQFSVTGPPPEPDPTTPPEFLVLPAIVPLPTETVTRQLALIEKMGTGRDAQGEQVEGPVEAVLGTVGPDAVDGSVPDGSWSERLWRDPITENPEVGATEVWAFHNTTGDAHPMHIHEVLFEVVNREGLVMADDDEVAVPVRYDGNVMPPQPWETGFKDTVIAYPGQVTRVRAQFSAPGQFVWHCHIVEHEDNEMMRPFRVGPVQEGQPGQPE